jgi:hypothetical protein
MCVATWFRPADMQRVAGHRDRILGRCGELVPIVQFYNGVLKRSSGGKSRTAITRASWSRRSLIHAWALSYTNVRGDDGHSGDWRGAAYSNTVRHTSHLIKTLNGLYLSGFDVSRIMTNPTVKAFWVVRRQRDRQIQIQGRNQISVPEPEPDSGWNTATTRAKL